MMTAENTSAKTIKEFIASKQTSLFQKLKEPRFTGQLILTNYEGIEWKFYLYLGRIMYATGGIHPVRRWRRNVALYFPEISYDLASLQRELAAVPNRDCNICWEYQTLCIWLDKQEIARAQVDKMIRAVISEILFDLLQL